MVYFSWVPIIFFIDEVRSEVRHGFWKRRDLFFLRLDHDTRWFSRETSSIREETIVLWKSKLEKNDLFVSIFWSIISKLRRVVWIASALSFWRRLFCTSRSINKNDSKTANVPKIEVLTRMWSNCSGGCCGYDSHDLEIFKFTFKPSKLSF